MSWFLCLAAGCRLLFFRNNDTTQPPAIQLPSSENNVFQLFIIRHGEKNDTLSRYDLSALGYERADYLAKNYNSIFNVSETNTIPPALFATDFVNRTRREWETLVPLSHRFGDDDIHLFDLLNEHQMIQDIKKRMMRQLNKQGTHPIFIIAWEHCAIPLLFQKVVREFPVSDAVSAAFVDRLLNSCWSDADFDTMVRFDVEFVAKDEEGDKVEYGANIMKIVVSQEGFALHPTADAPFECAVKAQIANQSLYQMYRCSQYN